MNTPRITVFTDCASQDVVMRVPYELAAQLIANAPDSDDRRELLQRINLAAQRSKPLTALIKQYDLR